MRVAFDTGRMKTFFMAVCGLALLSGCASVTVQKVDPASGKKMKKLPERIYVRDFDAPKENLRVDRIGEKLAEFQKDISGKLSKSLVQHLDHNLAPAEVVNDEATLKRGPAWLIVGRFDRIEQGSRALRSVLGFGLGGTKVVTTAAVYDLSTARPTRIMTIQTSGGSNATPGTVINLAPVVVLGPVGMVAGGVVAGVVPGVFPGLGSDVKRTAREIAAVLSEYSHQQGLIDEKLAMNPKRAGSGTIRLTDPERAK